MEENKIPTAKDFLENLEEEDAELLDSIIGGDMSPNFIKQVISNLMVEFAKLHVQAALKEAYMETGNGGILTAYPLENIK